MRRLTIFLLALACACAPEAKVIDSPVVRQMELGQKAGTQSFDHATWDGLLREAVRTDDGLVDYAALKAREGELDAYLKTISDVDLSKLNHNEQFALLLNAYNAYTVKLILEHYPGVRSIRDLSDPWKTRRYGVAGQTLSLDDIEHGLLRPIFRDPRIHFAVNCASVGCPPLSAQAFVGRTVDAQLERATRQALSNPRYAVADGDNLRVTAILDWYGADMTDETYMGHAKTVPVWVARYANSDVKDLVKRKGGKPNLHFLNYDWSLNDVKR